MNFFSLFKRSLIYKFKKKISIDDDNVNFESLDKLFYHYGSDKADIFSASKERGHGYSGFYEKKIRNFKNKKINILEIGSYAGASAAAFTKYFPQANIFCFDLNISNFKYTSKNIHVYGLDIKDDEKVKKTFNSILKKFNIKEFDIIIDDGSHLLSDISKNFVFFF